MSNNLPASTTPSAPSRSSRRPLITLLLAVAIIQFLTMPDFHYRGDALAPRAEAIQWITKGDFGIPYADRGQVAPLVDVRGKYLYENDARQRLHSKYGIANDLLYFPPLLAEAMTGATFVPVQTTRSLLLWLNLYQIIWALLVTTYLYRLAAIHTEREPLRVGFVLASIYTTMLWHYLRAPTTEIFQVAALLGLIYHTMQFLHARTAEAPTAETWRQLGYATLWASSLSLMRTSFVPLHLALALYLLQWSPGAALLQGIRANLTAHAKPLLRYLLLPSLLGAGILLWSNDYRFGSALNSGYGQWLSPSGAAEVSFSMDHLAKNLNLFLLNPGNGNLFLHYPLLFLALLGWRDFMREYRPGAVLLLILAVAFIIPILTYNHADGEWCYGPRLLLPMLPVLALPAIQGWQRICSRRSRRLEQFLVVEIALLSLVLQIGVNALDYFTWYDIKDFMGDAIPGVTDRYLNGVWHRGVLHLQLIAFSWWKFPAFPLLEMIRPSLPPEALTQTEQILHQFATPNFWFAR